jgi:hypothetical protein
MHIYSGHNNRAFQTDVTTLSQLEWQASRPRSKTELGSGCPTSRMYQAKTVLQLLVRVYGLSTMCYNERNRKETWLY